MAPAAPYALGCRARVERRLGAVLLRMREGRLFRLVGFVRLSDYVVERLGLSYRTAQELMRVEEALGRLPAAAAAFEAGLITSSHVRLVSRVASPETEAFWVGLSRRLGVRELAAAVDRAARDNDGKEEGATAGAAEAGEEPAPERLEIEAPAWVAHCWRETVVLVRKLVGTSAPAGTCLEMVLAEFAAGGASHVDAGPSAEGDASFHTKTEADADAGADAEIEVEADADGDADAAVEADAGTGVPATSDEPAGEQKVHVSAPLRQVESGLTSSIPVDRGETAGDTLDAEAADAELRNLMTERQRLEAALAGHLHAAGSERRYLPEGFTSLEAYARDRFGLCRRRLFYLLKLHITLQRLPALHERFLGGRLTLSQALLVGSVATRATEVAWIARAEIVTLRRLEDEVEFWRQLRESRPKIWELLGGNPLPEGIALVPGQPARVQVSARPGFTDSSKGEAVSTIPASDLLDALRADEAVTPLPPRMCRIRMHVEPGVKEMWKETVARCRSGGRDALKEWEVLVLVMHDFWKTWDNRETRRQSRENPTLVRDGWRCTAPGCRSLGTGRLQVHHIRLKSAGGSDDPSNLTGLCSIHHLGLLHEGLMRCSGRAPDELLWEFGVKEEKGPFLVYAGETRIGGSAL